MHQPFLQRPGTYKKIGWEVFFYFASWTIKRKPLRNQHIFRGRKRGVNFKLFLEKERCSLSCYSCPRLNFCGFRCHCNLFLFHTFSLYFRPTTTVLNCSLFRLQIRRGFPMKSRKNFFVPLFNLRMISASHATLCSDEPLPILLWFFCYFVQFLLEFSFLTIFCFHFFVK